MHVVSPWNRPFLTVLLIWLVAGYFPCALSFEYKERSDPSGLSYYNNNNNNNNNNVYLIKRSY